MRTILRCLLFLAALLSANPSRAGETADDIKRRFLAEFPDACERYSARLRPYQRQSESLSKDLGQGKVLAKDTTQLRKNGPWGLIIVTPDPSSTEPKEARAVNSRYVFVLRKKPGQDWVLHDFHDRSGGVPRSIYYFGLDEEARGPYWIPPTIWVPDAIKQPEFVIRDAAEQNEGNRRLIRITYEFKKPNQPETNSGYLVFDPERFWLVMEQENTMSRANSALTSKYRYEYVQDGDLPLIARTTCLKTSPFFPDHPVEETSSTRYTREIAEESEFTLSAFGLPEPLGVEWKRRTPRYIWILAGAGAFVLLAAGLFWLARRQGAKARAKS